jgi:uncharacterized RDD family membrane protein YckC
MGMSYNNGPRPPLPLPGEGSSQGSFRYASFQHRLAALALDASFLGVALLMVFTIILSPIGIILGLGWFIWSIIVWGEGQTPAKKILKIRVRNSESGAVATRGHMAVREFLVPLTVAIATALTFQIALVAWIVIEIVFYFTKNNRTSRDLWLKTAVINEA